MKLTEIDLNQHIAQRHSPLVTRNGGQRVDTDLLLASGALVGPHKRTRPLTVSRLQRLCRAVRALLLNWRTTL